MIEKLSENLEIFALVLPFRLQNVLYLDQTHLWPFTKRTFSCLFRCGFMFISCRFDYVLPYASCAAVEWM